MPLYGNLIYGSGETYGQPASLPFSVEPFNSLAVWYDKILLNWTPSESNYSAFRLVRNQDALPETSEDGLILFDWTSESDIAKSSLPISYIDGTTDDLALTPGKYVYYRVWLFDDREVWVIGGETAVLLPEQFGQNSPFLKTSQEKMLELIPKQFTAPDYSPNGAIDFDSELAAFLEGFSFTADELLTDLAVLQSPFYGAFQNPALLLLQGQQLGVTSEVGTVSRQQKKTVREAMFTYQRKGTPFAISSFAESTTGYAPTIRTSPNLMLSIEDSSFYKGVGSWALLGQGTLTSEATGDVPTAETDACDFSYVAKAVTSGAVTLTNGILSPILYGVPVSYGKKYTFSFYTKTESGTTSVTPKITWYNFRGEQLSSVTGTAVNSTTTWAKQSVTGFVPGYVGEISSLTVLSDVATITTASEHPFVVGDSVAVTGLLDEFNGTHVITAVTGTSFSFATAEDDGALDEVSGFVQLSTWKFAESGVYATVDIAIAAATTIYFDMVQVAESTVTTYAEARCTGIILAPSKTNFIKNPSFLETGFAWTIDASASDYSPTSIVGVYGGLTMLELTPNETGVTSLSTETDANLETDKFYSFSIHSRTAAGVEVATLTMEAIDVDTDDVVVTRSITADITDKWTRPGVSFYLPASDLNIKIQVSVEFTDAAEDIYFDCAQVEQSLTPTDYVDGSMPPDYGTGWYGDEHESASFAYVNKENRLARLLSEIDKFVPFGGSYRVITEFGVEKTEITY